MKLDYLYCANKDTCIHRRGCKRWLGNYPDEEVKELYTESRFVNEIDDEDCMRGDMDCDNVKYPFDMLVRFRNSDRSNNAIPTST